VIGAPKARQQWRRQAKAKFATLDDVEVAFIEHPECGTKEWPLLFLNHLPST